MSESRHRPPAFFVNGRPDVTRGVQAGVQWLADRTAEHGGVPLIITPARESKGRVVQMAPGAATVTSETFRNMLRSPWKGGLVLAVWADDKVLAQIDDDYRVTAVCTVLVSLAHAPLWLKARRPVEIGGTQSVLPPDVAVDPVVDVALRGLTTVINLSTGLVNPSDRSRAISVLRALHAGRKALSPDDAHAWAIRHGWRADGARDLRELVIGVAQAKRYRQTEGLRPASELLAMWERQAANE